MNARVTDNVQLIHGHVINYLDNRGTRQRLKLCKEGKWKETFTDRDIENGMQ